MRRRPALTFTLVLLAAAALHAVSVARQSTDATDSRVAGDKDYICTACGPMPKSGAACPIAPPAQSPSNAQISDGSPSDVDQP